MLDGIFDSIGDEINELVSEFYPQAVVGDLNFGITQYTFWLFVAAIVLVALVFYFVKHLSLVPHGWFMNGFESIIEYVRDNICINILGENWREHFPFLMSVFFFVLINNVVGIIPGMKPGTGTISVTAAIAVVVFVYFIAAGIKKRGAWSYIKSLCPSGVSFPINILVWLIELVSTILRPITLAIRLFCNMFAGHIVLGSFAILASVCCEPLTEALTLANAAGLLPSALFMLILLIIYAIEMFVAFIQAYVFTMLSAVYINSAISEE